MAASDPALAGAPVERFQPTSGALHGYGGLTVVALGIAYIAVAVPTLNGLRVALALATFGVLVWITQLRPRATLYPESLLIKNSLVDVLIPLRLVEDVDVSRTLNVWVGRKRHVCIGIGTSMRSLFQGSRSSKSAAAGLFGAGRLHDYAESGGRGRSDQTATAYETFVVQRIEDQIGEAKGTPATGTERVRHLPAWLPIVALTVTATAFLVSLLV